MKFKLRDWQEKYLKAVTPMCSRSAVAAATGEQDTALIVSPPATGKTHPTCILIAQFLRENPKGKVIVVAPQRGVARQWRKKLHKEFGVVLDVPENGKLRSFGGPHNKGVIITYALIKKDASSAISRVCKEMPVMVVFDEVHHLADKGSWGAFASEATRFARVRIALSGTPFRSDEYRISLLKPNDDGVGYKTAFEYKYVNAVSDGAIRQVAFEPFDSGDIDVPDIGSVRLSGVSGIDDKKLTKTGKKNLSNKLRGDAVRSDDFIRGMFIAANKRLNQVRRVKPDAAGLFMACNIEQAHQVARIICSVDESIDPVVVTSDEPTAVTMIEDFSKSNARWIVSVNMISEGTDIPRLCVLAYAHGYQTELFFRQTVGRITRTQDSDPGRGFLAHFIYPCDSGLNEFAMSIESEQERASRMPPEFLPPSGGEPGDGPKPPPPPPPPRHVFHVPAGDFGGPVTIGSKSLTLEKYNVWLALRDLIDPSSAMAFVDGLSDADIDEHDLLFDLAKIGVSRSDAKSIIASIKTPKIAIVNSDSKAVDKTSESSGQAPSHKKYMEHVRELMKTNVARITGITKHSGRDYRWWSIQVNNRLGVNAIEDCKDIHAIDETLEWLKGVLASEKKKAKKAA